MLLVDGQITMSEDEWLKFEGLNWAPWRPRTPGEFNAMCELAAERHLVENTAGNGVIFAISCRTMKFGPDGAINFPEDHRRLAYVKVHGNWPTDAELAAFEGQTERVAGLTLVASHGAPKPVL